ncbi:MULTISPECIES: alpha/beta fold hydrolase [Arthrobacter]|uniref:Alpha/beta fold hydrolase n=2 Tax=Arthrobacter TaxID=1663 RepID=A0ABU9KMA3_9MICC|nr:alpha/beta fold hydrolase [Arthrobacter sp. YJM1]MDP5228146.1 alpha/beta fold hydrolase [Arthrobacter sp. YJM1]
MTHFVLVHGAFHGGWCWSDIVAGLDAKGHTAVAPDLPGSGDDPTPVSEVTLESAAARIVEELKAEDGPSVLVAHSMGGIVMTQVAAQVPELISKMIYVTAFRPVDGESLLALAGLPEGAGDGVQANSTVAGDPPVVIFDMTKSHEVFGTGVPADIAQAAAERLTPQPASLFATPVSIAGAQLPPTEYVICTQDRAIPPALQELMAARAPEATIHRLDTGHSPFYSAPEELLEILLG